MKKRVCIIMSAVALLAIAQTAGAKVNGSILTEPKWGSTTNSQSVVATSTSNSFSLRANPTTSNSPMAVNSPDGFTSMESHHGGGGSGGGLEGKNMVDLGVGFGGGLSSYSYGGAYSTSGGIGFFGKFEHMLTGNIGLALSVSYASSTETATETGYSNTGVPYSYTDGWKFTAIGVMARGAYHFTVNDNFDPYVGLGLGYFAFSSSYFNNDPNTNNNNNLVLVSPSIGGFGYTVFAGARYYFASSIGAFLELGFDGYAGNLVKVGLALKF